MKKDLKRRYQEKEVEVFKKTIKSGLKLSMAELSKLNAVKKSEYIKHQVS